MDPMTRRMLDGIKSRMERAGTVAEAEAAAAAMQRMILKHNLDAADLENLGKQEREEYISKYIILGKEKTQGLQWRVNLAYVMGEMNFCAFIRQGIHGAKGWMVGQASNVEAAEVMYVSIVDANERLAPTEWAAFIRTSEGRFANSGSWKNSFKIGFVQGIRMQMLAERKRVAGELEAGTVSALVLVKDAELKQAVNEKIGKTTTHKGSAPTNSSGFQRGLEKGLSHEFRARLDG